MKLLTLRLDNFQGIKTAAFSFGGSSASIFGDNATGKTTVFNALTWLLFDKASTGAKNFCPKTMGPNGELHNLEHAAEAELMLEDGRIVTLRKVFHEVYKKKRGSASAEFDGHTIDFFIDGVPVKEKEFTAAILDMCGDIEKMKMLTMPTYFPEDMAWDARRKILLEICGDVSDDDVIAANPALADLPKYLAISGNSGRLYGVDEYRKIAAAQKSEINRELESIPTRIDEAQKAKPDIHGITETELDGLIVTLKQDRGAASRQRLDIISRGSDVDAIRQRRASLRTEIAEAKAQHAEEQGRQNESTYAAIREKKQSLADALSFLVDTNARLNAARENIKAMTEQREKLVEEYNQAAAEKWNDAESACPTCRRPLPEEEAHRLKEQFNLRRGSKLEEINQRGQAYSKEMIAKQEAVIESCESWIRSISSDAERIRAEIAELESGLLPVIPFEETEQYKRFSDEQAAIDTLENGSAEAVAAQTAPIDERLRKIDSDINTAEDAKLQLKMVAAQDRRIAELEEREKYLAAKYEETERGVYLCEQFIKSKVGMLTDRINGKFMSVRFRLFTEQINGGLKEDCEVMIPAEDGRMVPFSFANNAARINAGLEIIDALSAYWGFSMPVFIDNAESVTKLLQIDTQVIRLVVSEQDKKLKVEVA